LFHLSDSKARPRPVVIDFQSGAKTAGLVLWNGWKDGVTGMIRQPRAGYKRHGILGGAAGSLIATVNILIKPGLGTLSSITWLGRGIHASVRNVLEKYKKEGRRLSPKLFDVTSSLSIANNEETQNENDREVSSTAKMAANISGFHPKVCQNIIDEFEKIKAKHERHMDSSSTRKKYPLPYFSNKNKSKRSSSWDIHAHS
jgi:hypothetical protein